MNFLRALSFSILVLGTACHTGSGPASLKPLPFGVMDEPRSGETLHGAAQVRGWALSESGIAQVRIYVDRNYVASATLGADRPDVVKAFPAFASHPDAGWAAVIDTSPANSTDWLKSASSAAWACTSAAA